MKLVATGVIAIVLGLAPSAHADSEVVLSAGPEVGLLEDPSAELPELHTGYFLRLALTPGIPAYTQAAKGYRWRSGLSGELIIRGGNTDENGTDRYAGATVGLRFDIAFSQRRMGLLEVSGRGGFYFAARAGLIRANSFAGPDSSLVVPDVAGGSRGDGRRMELAPDTQRTGSIAVGTYILLGKTLRLGTELGAFAMGYSRDIDPRVGAIMRVSLGASL